MKKSCVGCKYNFRSDKKEPSELPKDKMLWVTHDNGFFKYVGVVSYDMTEWSESVSDVVAYMPYEEPESYEGKRE